MEAALGDWGRQTGLMVKVLARNIKEFILDFVSQCSQPYLWIGILAAIGAIVHMQIPKRPFAQELLVH